MNRPNIITVYNIDESGGLHIIAMECVEGKALDEPLAHQRLRLNEALKHAVRIADALATAHKAQYGSLKKVHPDASRNPVSGQCQHKATNRQLDGKRYGARCDLAFELTAPQRCGAMQLSDFACAAAARRLVTGFVRIHQTKVPFRQARIGFPAQPAGIPSVLAIVEAH